MSSLRLLREDIKTLKCCNADIDMFKTTRGKKALRRVLFDLFIRV